jgi:hypothetical protein
MAGPYAHILVCERARKLTSLDQKLGNLLATHPCMLSLGAVSPDLPAIWDNVPVVGGEHWSDRFHSPKNNDPMVATNLVVEKAYGEIRSIVDDQARLAGLAWLLGYIGHMVTDVVIHPVVRECIKQAKAEGISDGGVLHQQVEIVMDTMLVKLLLDKNDVAHAPLLGWLQGADHDQHRRQVMNAWAKAITAVYGGSADPGHWYDLYVNALALVDDTPFRFRGYTYPDFGGIQDFERSMYFERVILPNDTIGTYQSVFDRAVTKVADFWKTTWNRWTSGGAFTNVIPNWDLNSGENYTAKILHDLWPESDMPGLKPPKGGMPPLPG